MGRKKMRTSDEQHDAVKKEIADGAAVGLGRRLFPAVKSLALSSMFSDIAIVAEGKEIPAHRVILASSSTFFSKCLSVDMKEKLEGVIRLPESYAVVSAVLTFLYTSNYEDKATDLTLGELHVQVYIAALKYDIPSLAKTALRKFEVLARAQSKKIIELGTVAEREGELSELLDHIKMLFAHTHETNDKMRIAAVEILKSIVQANEQDLERSRLWSEFVAEVPQCALALLAMLAKKPDDAPPKMYICPNVSCKRQSTQLLCITCHQSFDIAKWLTDATPAAGTA